MLTLTAIIVFFFFCTMLQILAVWGGARWAGVQRHSFLRAFAALALVAAIARIVQLPVDLELIPRPPVFVNILIAILVAIAVSRLVFGARFREMVKLWLPFIACNVFNVAAVFFIVVPCLFHCFIMPNNAMAPTLLGPHYVAKCPHCGGNLVIDYRPQAGSEPELAICARCKQITTSDEAEGHIEGREADRFCVNRLMSPARWDVIAVQYPPESGSFYAKRLVGLPGEEVVIKDGAVWIDGKRLQPPRELRGLKFEGSPRTTYAGWSSPEYPAKLGRGEYFVVGDFGPRSSDSRTWTKGPPGHPYAVSAANVGGVVSLIYWPPSRWRIFR
jgi:signal peptidase I